MRRVGERGKHNNYKAEVWEMNNYKGEVGDFGRKNAAFILEIAYIMVLALV